MARPTARASAYCSACQRVPQRVLQRAVAGHVHVPQLCAAMAVVRRFLERVRNGQCTPVGIAANSCKHPLLVTSLLARILLFRWGREPSESGCDLGSATTPETAEKNTRQAQGCERTERQCAELCEERLTEA